VFHLLGLHDVFIVELYNINKYIEEYVVLNREMRRTRGRQKKAGRSLACTLKIVTKKVVSQVSSGKKQISRLLVHQENFLEKIP